MELSEQARAAKSSETEQSHRLGVLKPKLPLNLPGCSDQSQRACAGSVSWSQRPGLVGVAVQRNAHQADDVD
jgi:hypothetical protein